MDWTRGGSPASSRSLVIGNLVPLAGVVGAEWSLHTLLVGYWLESGVVGAIYMAKILRAEGKSSDDGSFSVPTKQDQTESYSQWTNRLVALFFIVHYGGFWTVHGLFVFIIPLAFDSVALASPRAVGVAAFGLFGYHLVSYWVNYIGNAEYAHVDPSTLMSEPYRRVAVLHLTILFGAFLIAGLGAPVGALIVMIAVKTVIDLRQHKEEHTRAEQRPPQSPDAE